jgi:hypothetical protein
MINNPARPCLGKFTDADCMPFSDDSHLWDTFDIRVGVDNVFEQPIDEVVIQRLQNRYVRLGERCRVYAA